jgi:ketosteroid isomerase-like protein
LTSAVVKTLRAGDLALTHAMWELVLTATDGSRRQNTGRGTIVSQRGPDGTWRVMLDDPLSQGDAAGSVEDAASYNVADGSAGS